MLATRKSSEDRFTGHLWGKSAVTGGFALKGPATQKRFHGMTSSWGRWWVTMVTTLYCGATWWKIPGGRPGLPLIHCWQIKKPPWVCRYFRVTFVVTKCNKKITRVMLDIGNAVTGWAEMKMAFVYSPVEQCYIHVIYLWTIMTFRLF